MKPSLKQVLTSPATHHPANPGLGNHPNPLLYQHLSGDLILGVD
jgi:hypothetical protein